MKRNAFYRRSRNYDGRIAGLNERLVWHLSKHGNSTGSDIAAALNVPLPLFNKYVGAYIKRKTVVHIERHGHYITPEGLNDYTYELIHFGNGSFVSNKPGIKKNIVINPAKGKRASSEARDAAIRKAKIRARLIASGLYCDEMG